MHLPRSGTDFAKVFGRTRRESAALQVARYWSRARISVKSSRPRNRRFRGRLPPFGRKTRRVWAFGILQISFVRRKPARHAFCIWHGDCDLSSFRAPSSAISDPGTRENSVHFPVFRSEGRLQSRMPAQKACRLQKSVPDHGGGCAFRHPGGVSGRGQGRMAGPAAGLRSEKINRSRSS